ncbi:MAG: isoleucine--tRNA ligase [Chitinispirillales bacterium]|jgi:isoleucyl-tRNA synthetase|nr:isoleucine--tRNA ligase [Chitinispirillales bacterium]
MSKEHFKQVNTKIQFPEIEREILEKWKEEDSFRESLKQNENNERFVFYDGPPFATGLPHYGHLLPGTIKDIVPRFWTMKGKYVERRFGWDTHGLPVENELEKEFKVSGKKQIEEMGLSLFNEACRSIVFRYTSQWKDAVERMGRWVDFENQYRTLDASFMESVWWVFRQVWDKNLIYSGFRVQPYCPRCSTPLSNFEVNEGYKDKKDVSITVKFPLVNEKNTSVLVWTTTPWTLPSNVVLAAGPDIDYVKVKDGEECFILAKARLGAYYKKESDYEIVAQYKGGDLVGLKYEPMFDYFTKVNDRFFQITTAQYVSTEDGTGVVHIAPAFGEDDFQVGKAMDLPIVCPVDSEGNFTTHVRDFAGKFVHSVNDEVIADIKKRGRLVHKQTIEHRYPFCYRCDTPLIYKAIDTWFMKIEPIRQNMLDSNNNIHWVPEHLQQGRFGNGLKSAPDWNLARNRYWGTPIPIWNCECGHIHCVGSLEELHELVGGGDKQKGERIHGETAKSVKENLDKTADLQFAKYNIDPKWAKSVKSTEISEIDLHPHVVNELKLICPKCKKIMKRTPEVLDCWFESGSMPYAQNHYPFENKDVFEKNFPAQFIAEGIDQTRGWFYTLTVLASALFGKEAFKNVVANGIILTEDGNKMSKRLKNYTPPQEMIEKCGADAIRLFLINSPAVRAEDLRFSEKGVMEMARSVLLPYWNAYSFFTTYANVDGWTPNTDALNSSNELDKWIISYLNHCIADVNTEMELYNLYKVVPLLVEFIDNLTNWYIRRSRRRFWKSENDDDKTAAYQTLYYVLVEFSKLMAPFLPFLTDAVYRNLVGSIDKNAEKSVHLCSFPVADNSKIDADVETRMNLVRQSVGIGRLLRARYTIKNRQPLSDITIIIRDEHKCDLLKEMSEIIAEELNVKEVKCIGDENAVLLVSAKPNFKRLGKTLGKDMKAVGDEIAKFTGKDILNLENGGVKIVLGYEIRFDDIELKREKRDGVEVETSGEITLALNTKITGELKNEGYARELINRIQNIRKERDYNVADRICVKVNCDEVLQNSLKTCESIIKSETLAISIEWCKTLSNAVKTEIDEFVLDLEISKGS